jgi:hypothetical protein
MIAAAPLRRLAQRRRGYVEPMYIGLGTLLLIIIILILVL